MRVRIGLADTGTDVDVDIDVDDVDAFAKELESAIESGTPLIWVEDEEHGRYAVAVNKIAYVHIEPEKARAVGLR